MFDYSFTDKPTLNIKSGKELGIGNNLVLDYICDSIVNHLPIFDEERWVPKYISENNIYAFNEEDILLGKRILKQGYDQYKNEQISYEDEYILYQINDENYYLPKNVFNNGELLYLYNEVNSSIDKNPHAYETSFLKIDENDVVFDLGACEGFFIRYALKRNAEKIYAFECLNRLKNALEKTYNKEIITDQVNIINKAISDSNQTIKINTNLNNICEAKVSEDGNEIVDGITLDTFVQDNSIEKINFIKMDIEGAEMAALMGMKEILVDFGPKLSIAVYHEYENAIKVKDIIKSINPNYTVCFSGCYMWEKPYRPFMVYAFID